MSVKKGVIRGCVFDLTRRGTTAQNVINNNQMLPKGVSRRAVVLPRVTCTQLTVPFIQVLLLDCTVILVKSKLLCVQFIRHFLVTRLPHTRMRPTGDPIAINNRDKQTMYHEVKHYMSKPTIPVLTSGASWPLIEKKKIRTKKIKLSTSRRMDGLPANVQEPTAGWHCQQGHHVPIIDHLSNKLLDIIIRYLNPDAMYSAQTCVSR